MPILGIDYEKCSNCATCVRACQRYLYEETDTDKIIYQDPNQVCISCGHCIARCPEDAVLYEDMGTSYTYDGVSYPETSVSYDYLYDLLRTLRSVRQYKKEKVPNKLLQKVFDAMQYAPTGRNMRSESFSILSDNEKIKTLSDAVKETFLTNPLNKDIYTKRFTNLSKEFHAPIFYDAPHVIFVTSQLDMRLADQNIANVITYGMLAARSLGLGTCWNGWTQGAMELDPKIMKIARIEGKRVGVFTIGYPDVKLYRTPPRYMKHVKGL